MKNSKKGFTLIELLVVVIIIGILAAIALPQYRRAVVRSKFHALMPIAKSLASSNEAYYLEYNHYTEDPEELLVQGKLDSYPDGTTVLLYNDPETLSFVRTANDDIPNIRYVVTQKHSANMPDTSWCEANDEAGEELCEAFGGEIPNGVMGNSGTEPDWTAYLLSGEAVGSFAGANVGGGSATCTGEQPANVTAGQTGATGTAICVNGEWKYEWSGGSACSPGCTCRGSAAYDCSGKNFDTLWSSCGGNVPYACTGSVFSGDKSLCAGNDTNGCTGVTIQAGGECWANVENSCENVIYAAHPDKDSGLLGCCRGSYCPTGTPKCKTDGSGEAVWNNTTHAYDTDGWVGNCCDPNVVNGVANCGSTPMCP